MGRVVSEMLLMGKDTGIRRSARARRQTGFGSRRTCAAMTVPLVSQYTLDLAAMVIVFLTLVAIPVAFIWDKWRKK
jgi:hypothetical protein